MKNTYYNLVIHNKIQISENTLLIELSFANQDHANFNFIAGQFIQIFIEVDGKEHRRSYSIANSPQNFRQTNLIQVVLSHVEGGVASEFFKNVTIGKAIKIRGPFGVLILPEIASGNIILIGTGTGLAPYRSMLNIFTSDYTKNVDVTVISGFRYRSEAIFQQDFDQTENINHFICYSREKQLLNSNELCGHVQDKIEHLNLDSTKDIIFLCGNPYMIDDCFTLFKKLHFGVKQVKREKYIYSGH